MKILIATHNKSKLKLYKDIFKDFDVDIMSLNDLSIDYVVDESGTSPTENSYIKAKEYNEISNMITISIDDGLEFFDYPKERQPGVNVRRINGITRDDDYMIDYYVSEVKKYGKEGKLYGKWIKSLSIAIDKDNIFTHDFFVEKVFVDKVNTRRNEGYPLDSISITKEFNKYTVELTDSENRELRNTNQKELLDFIVKTLKLKKRI
jgi:inosine/xanthosine triphosphate pyrophosphatase family protein